MARLEWVSWVTFIQTRHLLHGASSDFPNMDRVSPYLVSHGPHHTLPCIIKILYVHCVYPFVSMVVFVCLGWRSLDYSCFAQSMPYHCPCFTQSLLLILEINVFSLIPIPYFHSPLPTGHYFTVLMGIFIWRFSCKMCIVDLYTYVFKVYMNGIICYISFCFLLFAFNTWTCCCVTCNSSCLTLLCVCTPLSH